MTGLKPDTDHIIEIATVVTDKHLNTLAEGPVLAIHQSDAVLDAMDDWNRRQHGTSGLAARVRASTITVQRRRSAQTLDFLARWIEPGVSPMCGNSICQDRRFLAREMPELERYFHYRNLDVSTLKELARRWVAGSIQRLPEELDAPGARRHPRFDPRAAALPHDFPARPVKPHSDACERNREPILQVLQQWFTQPGTGWRSAPAPGSTPCTSPRICRTSVAADRLRGESRRHRLVGERSSAAEPARTR